MNLNLNNKTALVCGSTQGIGRSAAMELAALGARVILMARNEEQLTHVVAGLPTPNQQEHHYLVADFTKPEEVAAKVKSFITEKNPIHILVNNTGGPPGGPIINASVEAFDNAFRQHLLCNHLIAQAVIDGMKDAKYGRIINVISTSVKQPLKGLGVSNTIRAAVANWSKTLSVEVAPFGITVNNVLPGATATNRLSTLLDTKSKQSGRAYETLEQEMLHEIPAGRFGSPDEIGSAIAFLASPSAGYINGINLPVDGGRTGCL
jgi:3-oxoacyl-[acyl-carrier protein] reductase